jgi:hypothetical protein
LPRANDASPRSVAAFVVLPVLLAIVADRVISAVRTHHRGDEETSSA